MASVRNVGKTPKSDLHRDTVTSGHSSLKKLQFTAVSFGSLFAIGAIGPMREIYVLKFGADVTAMAVVGFIVAFWSAFCDPFSGYFQDKYFEWYECIMPKNVWGKRAPYMSLSLVALTVVVFAAYFPPSGTYVWWYLWVSLIATWSWSTINVTYGASLLWLYKFKNERVFVEGFGYIMKSAGLLLGFFFFVITLQDARASVRAVQALVAAGIFIFCQISVPVVKTVREKESTTESTADSICDSATELWRFNDAFATLCVVNAFDGCRSSMTILVPYYLTYTSKESLDARSGYIVGMLLGVLVTKVALILPTQYFVNKYGSSVSCKFRMIDVVCQILAGLMAPACLLINDGGAMLLLFILLREFFKTPHLFWILMAATWVVDEDVLTKRKAREGLIIGGLSMCFQLAGAVFGASIYIGMGSLGLDVEDCSEYDDDDNLYEACYESDQAKQPAVVGRYFRFLFVIAYPVLSILMSIAIYYFPIYGDRLAKLERDKKNALSPADSPKCAEEDAPGLELPGTSGVGSDRAF